jgi:hypothetical protein
MTQQHPVSQIARLVYDRPDSDVAMATELRIAPEELAQWLAADLAPRTRLLLKGFAAKKAAVLAQRARQLVEFSDAL